MTAKRRFEISVISALIFSVLLSMVRFEASCTELKEKVLRLHILANSDSKADQELKIKVRDRLLKLDIYDGATEKEEAIKYSEDNLGLIIKEAEKVIREEGFNYKVSAEITNCYFETRHYDSFSLPAGNYDALRIKIGKAEGENWWCVIFPKLCLGASIEKETNLTNSSKDIAKNSKDYKVKFKIVDFFSGLKNKFNTWFS